MRARGCDVITKGVQQAPPDQLRHHLRPRAPVRARNDPDPPGRVPTCPGTLRTPRRVIKGPLWQLLNVENRESRKGGLRAEFWFGTDPETWCGVMGRI